MKGFKIFIPLIALTLAGCDVLESGDKLNVYTSFFVMEDLAKKVGGDYVNVTSIVPSGSEIHSYEPTTGDIRNLSQADLFIYNGVGLEHFIDQLKNAIDNPNLVYVEASENIELLSDEDHDDPHVWLSPLNAKKEMENIKRALVEVDAAHSSYYENRYQLFADKFDELDLQYQTLLSPGAGSYLVTGHAAFGYLANEYDLLPLPIAGHDSEQEPTQQDIANVINIVNQNNIPYIYAESLTPSDAVLTVLEETNAELEILYAIEGLSANQMMTNEDYFSLMKDNLFALAKGFI
ncbi:MAG: zinc ABC transporter substrate-binding protein [Bacilli bacterium]|jgi:zinc transport system substrate-binding protein|nr:zinc ABC transporter substrate-binding protein [Bacilli bacterium]